MSGPDRGLRAVIRPDRAILTIDLGEDKQVAVLLDHDGRVLGRRTVLAKAFTLGALPDWAAGHVGTGSAEWWSGVNRCRGRRGSDPGRDR
jgi:transposase